MILWAHGLEGSPQGKKVQGLRAAGLDVVAPDGRGLALRQRLDELLRVSDRLADQRPVLAGSSYGGLAAAWLCATHPERFRGVLLLAPALHYAEDPVASVEDLVAPVGVPVRIIHGCADAVVPIEASREFVRRSSLVAGVDVCLTEVDDSHSLVDSLSTIIGHLKLLMES